MSIMVRVVEMFRDVRRAALPCWLGLVVSGSGVGAQESFPDCYGDTIDVRIQIYEADAESDGYVVLALPNPESWSLQGRGVGRLDTAACLDEPVPVSRAASSAMLSKFRRAFPDRAEAVRRLGSIELSSSTESVSEGIYKRLHKPEEWSQVDHGFKRRMSTQEFYTTYGNLEFVAGSFHFPENYPTPFGYPVHAFCTGFGTCKVDYRLYERLVVRYTFSSSLDYQETWIPQDQAVREMVGDLIVAR